MSPASTSVTPAPRPPVTLGFRSMDPTDRPYIIASWLRFGKGRLADQYLDYDVYFRCHHKLIEALIADHDVVVAHHPEAPHVIVGYICGNAYAAAGVVHFLYVRNQLRNHGVGKQLLAAVGITEDMPIVSTTWNKWVDVRVANMARDVVYNPYMAHKGYREVLHGSRPIRTGTQTWTPTQSTPKPPGRTPQANGAPRDKPGHTEDGSAGTAHGSVLIKGQRVPVTRVRRQPTREV